MGTHQTHHPTHGNKHNYPEMMESLADVVMSCGIDTVSVVLDFEENPWKLSCPRT